jgi:F-type H+-transporting ATPase subunit epsilon
VRTASDERLYAVYGGFLELREGRLVVLADSAEEPDRIDRSTAESLRQDAEARLHADADDVTAQRDLKRANLALELAS